MSRLATFVISEIHGRAVRWLLWLAAFALMLSGATWFVAEEVASNMRDVARHELSEYQVLRSNVLGTFEAMEQRLTSVPCSPAFLDELRRIAFLPDGINELLYMDGDNVICSVNSGVFPQPKALSDPDIVSVNPYSMALWMDRDLTILGLPGMTGTIARKGGFGMVIPDQPPPAAPPRWLDVEVIVSAGDGRWWHRVGMAGVYRDVIDHPAAPVASLFTGALRHLECDHAGIHCLAVRTTLGNLFALGWTTLGVILLIAAVLAAWLAQYLHRLIQNYWSFETRFLRKMTSGTVICAYQPLLDLRTDTISGCEVLARWRDIDGAIVGPDRFLPIVERHGLTARFTRMVVDQAYHDLQNLPGKDRLQVNFNIFPQDLRAELLLPIFSRFLAATSRFDLVLEIVETAEIPVATAQMEIEALRAAGARVYVDDFGAGYSSMHSLAALSIDGVKLDRSFGMAPDQSIMARMLDHAIDLVQAAERSVVVEGVETFDRLEHLRANGKVDLAQGYVISRPVLIEPFIALRREWSRQRTRSRRQVA